MVETNNDVDELDELDDLVGLTKRVITEEQRRKFEGYAAEILDLPWDGLENPKHMRHPTKVHPGIDRCHQRVRRGSQAAKDLPHRMPRRARLPVKPGDRGSDPFLFILRASRLPILRRGLRGIYCQRKYHRHIQADPARAPVRPTLCRPGTDRAAGGGYPRSNAATARRGGLPAGTSPVRGDARGEGTGADHAHLGLARLLCR